MRSTPSSLCPASRGPLHGTLSWRVLRRLTAAGAALALGLLAQGRPVQRDPGAVGQAQAALMASGGAAGVICLTGSATVPAKGGGSLSYPLRACVSGASSRVDSTLPTGTRTRVVSGGLGAIRQPDGRVQALRYRNTLYEQPIYLPGLLLGGLLADAQRSVLAQSGEIDFPAELPLGPLHKNLHERAQVRVVLDSQGRVERALWHESGEQYEDDDSPVEVRYGDYGPLNGLVVPRTVEERMDGTRGFTLQWTGVDLSPNLPADFFTVPAAGGQK